MYREYQVLYPKYEINSSTLHLCLYVYYDIFPFAKYGDY
uniref:Uncharacterized protein n=1 Tax=Lepeophtheirus salmonis TaxID=72036 RepID=A0A0K2UTP2_LEPSM